MFFTPLLQGAAQQQAGGSGLFLRNVSSAAFTASVDPGKPTGTQPTDLLIAVYTGSIGVSQSVSVPSGWTAIPGAAVLTTGQIRAWWALGSVTGTAFNDGTNGGSLPAVTIFAFAGADTTNPIRDAANKEEYDLTCTAPSVNANAGDALVQVWYDWQAFTNFGPALPGGPVDRVNINNGRTINATVENLTANGATLAQTRSANNFTGKRSVTIAIASATAQQVPRTFFPRKVYRARQPQTAIEPTARFGQIDLVYIPALATRYQWTGTGNKTESIYGVSHLVTTPAESLTSPRTTPAGAVSVLAIVKFNSLNQATFGSDLGATVFTQRENNLTDVSPTLCASNGGIANGTAGNFKFWFGCDAAGTGVGKSNPTLVQTGVWYIVAAAADANGVTGVAVNGVVGGDVGSPAGTWTSNWTGGPSRLGRSTAWGGGAPDLEIALFVRFRRTLSNAELSALTRNINAPWQVFRPTTQVISFAAQTPSIFRQRLRWARQPQNATQIDWSNPLTKGLVSASTPWFDAIKGGLNYNNITEPRLRNTAAGRLFSGFNGTSAYIAYADQASRVVPPFTVAFSIFYDPGNYSAQGLVAQGGASSGLGWSVRGGGLAIGLTFGNVQDYTLASNVLSATPRLCHICVTVSGNGGIARAYLDGRDVTNGGGVAVGTMLTPASTGTIIGAVNTGSGYGAYLQSGSSIGNIQIFNRALSANEIASLARNPNQIFRPTTRTIGTAVISGVTIYRPTSDITTTGWTASTGSVLYDMIDEVIPSDIDYILSPDVNAAPGPATFGIGSAPAGTYVISLRAMRTSSVGQIRALLKDSGGTTVGTSSWQTITGAFTTYNFSVTTTGTAAQLTIEVQP